MFNFLALLDIRVFGCLLPLLLLIGLILFTARLFLLTNIILIKSSTQRPVAGTHLVSFYCMTASGNTTITSNIHAMYGTAQFKLDYTRVRQLRTRLDTLLKIHTAYPECARKINDVKMLVKCACVHTRR